MQTETTIIAPAEAEGVSPDWIKTIVMLQLIGSATAQEKLLSVRALYSNARKYAGLDMPYSDFLYFLGSFRHDLDVRDGELGVDVNYIKMKTER